jgi:murein peptide amidase A
MNTTSLESRDTQNTPLTSSPVKQQRLSIRSLIAETLELALKNSRLFAQPLAPFTLHGETFQLPRFLLVGPQGGGDYLRIGIFAGIHGDETAGILATLHLLDELRRQPELATGYEIFVYPVCNPSGYEDGTRWSRSGKDLNREFWKGSRQPEVRQLEEELKGLHFHGIISLHSDDTSDGIYGFARGSSLTRHVLEPALAAASVELPINHGPVIDNFESENGIIERRCYQGILGAPPEAHPRPFEIVFETPQLADHDKQIRSHVLALKSILAHYRTLISVAQNI